jgi:hypothetical protein
MLGNGVSLFRRRAAMGQKGIVNDQTDHIRTVKMQQNDAKQSKLPLESRKEKDLTTMPTRNDASFCWNIGYGLAFRKIAVL